MPLPLLLLVGVEPAALRARGLPLPPPRMPAAAAAIAAAAAATVVDEVQGGLKGGALWLGQAVPLRTAASTATVAEVVVVVVDCRRRPPLPPPPVAWPSVSCTPPATPAPCRVPVGPAYQRPTVPVGGRSHCPPGVRGSGDPV